MTSPRATRQGIGGATGVEPAGSAFFFCVAAFLLLAPLYKAGNRPVPLLLLELAAIGLLLALVAQRRAPPALPRALWTAIAILVAYPLVQLVPLPDRAWRALPGHAEYAAVLERFAAEGRPAWRAISVIPAATERGWLALLPPLASLLAVVSLSRAQAVRLVLLLAIVAGGEALLGLLQVAPGGGGVLFLGNDEPGQNAAIGTFVNRNHLAALLAMLLPAIVGLVVAGAGPARPPGTGRATGPASESLARRVLLFASAVLILLCLLFTRSRAGIAAALIGLAAAAFLLVRARRPGAGAAAALVAALVALAIVLALAIGIEPIARAFAPGHLQGSADFRAGIYAATIRGAVEFLPFGSGLSTFAGVFPRFQTGDLGGYIDHAHNDYLQAFLELGLVAPVLVALLLGAYVARMRVLLRTGAAGGFALLQQGAGLGLLAVIVHSLFDFALHMPAVAMWFAALAGVMFHGHSRAR